MSKSSIDYCELSGLRIALSNLMHASKQNDVVIDWIKTRIKELEDK